MEMFNESLPCLGCGTPTKSRDDNNKPFCSDCKEKLADKKAKEEVQKRIAKKIGNEGVRKCSKCGSEMKKITYPDFETLLEDDEQEFVVIDKCPNCRSVFLDNGELKRIAKIIEENGESGGSSGAGFGTGLILGMAIG